MAIDAHDAPGPVVLVGEATEDWAGDARYHEYSAAADPVGSGTIPRVPLERFPAHLHHGPGSRLVPLDLSEAWSLIIDWIRDIRMSIALSIPVRTSTYRCSSDVAASRAVSRSSSAYSFDFGISPAARAPSTSMRQSSPT